MTLSGRTNSKDDTREGRTVSGLACGNAPIHVSGFVPTRTRTRVADGERSVTKLLDGCGPSVGVGLDATGPSSVEADVVAGVADPSSETCTLDCLGSVVSGRRCVGDLGINGSRSDVSKFSACGSVVDLDSLPGGGCSSACDGCIGRVFKSDDSVERCFGGSSICGSFVGTLNKRGGTTDLKVEFNSSNGNCECTRLPGSCRGSVCDFNGTIGRTRSAEGPLGTFLGSTGAEFFNCNSGFIEISSGNRRRRNKLPANGGRPCVNLVGCISSLGSGGSTILSNKRVGTSAVNVSTVAPRLTRLGFIVDSGPRTTDGCTTRGGRLRGRTVDTVGTKVSLARKRTCVADRGKMFRPVASRSEGTCATCLEDTGRGRVAPAVIHSPGANSIKIRVGVTNCCSARNGLGERPVALLMNDNTVSDSVVRS